MASGNPGVIGRRGARLLCSGQKMHSDLEKSTKAGTLEASLFAMQNVQQRTGAGASRLPRGLLLVGATHAHSVGLLAACAVVAVNKLLIALGHSSITIKLIEYILLMVHSDSYLLMVIPCLGL